MSLFIISTQNIKKLMMRLKNQYFVTVSKFQVIIHFLKTKKEIVDKMRVSKAHHMQLPCNKRHCQSIN